LFSTYQIYSTDLKPHHPPDLTQQTAMLTSMIMEKDEDLQEKQDKEVLLAIVALAVLGKPVAIQSL
jgi:hypothetical protein